MNLPNKLTVMRICLVPLFVTACLLPYVWGPIVATGLFLLAAFTDFLDGHIARKYNLITDLGKLLDPIADKVLVTAALFCIVATNPLSCLSLFEGNGLAFACNWAILGNIYVTICAIIILSRELLISAMRILAASKGVVLQANIYGKVKTVLQDVCLPFWVVTLCGKYAAGSSNNGTFFFVTGIVGFVLLGLATIMAVVSGTIYMVQNKSVFTGK